MHYSDVRNFVRVRVCACMCVHVGGYTGVPAHGRHVFCDQNNRKWRDV